jgi:hypothetical protein
LTIRKAPVLLVASPLQLSLNLFDFRGIACSERGFRGKDYEQHINKCVSRDVHQLSEHRLLLRRPRKKSFCGLAVLERLEAAIDLASLAARVELVPFPFVPNSGVFPQPVKAN